MKKLYIQEKEIFTNLFLKLPIVNRIENVSTMENGFVSEIELKDGYEFRIQAFVLQNAYPANLKKALNTKQNDKADYYIFMAPFVSDKVSEMCKDLKVGYLDYVGNCYIQYYSIYMSTSGIKNNVTKRGLKSVFEKSSIVSGIILRQMLMDIRKVWKMQELAQVAGCSIGQISKVKDFLKKNEWIEIEADGFRLKDADKLLLEWSNVHEQKSDLTYECYSLDGPVVVEKKLEEMNQTCGIEYYLTGFSGGVRYTPVVRYNKIHVYIRTEDVKEAMRFLNCKQVNSGSNITIIIPYDECVFIDNRIIKNSKVVSPVQAYLDCMQLKGRGAEIADAIFSKEINK